MSQSPLMVGENTSESRQKTVIIWNTTRWTTNGRWWC